jgi:ABC-type proline/glycine betaine transport system ATPase subunit
VAENIAMPFLRLFGNSIDAARARVAEVLDFVELDVSCANLLMGDLDEAAHWRVAFARSIAHQPKILIAVSPPALFLLPLARRYARQTGAAVLWNAGAADVRGLCERVLTPDCRMTSIPAS